jgi:high-affinity iron transporter
MFFSLLVSYKETLEAAVIIGSTVLYLSKYGKNYKVLYLYLGAAVGLTFSMFIIFFGFQTMQSITGNIKNMIQSAALFLVSLFIIFSVIIINKQDDSSSNFISRNISSNMRYVEKSIGLFLIGFFIEFKEGIELTILNIANLDKIPDLVLIGTISGMVLAILSVYIFFRKAIKLNIHIVLKPVSIFFVIVAGMMLGQSIFMVIPAQTNIFKLLLNVLFISAFLLVYLKNGISPEKS